MSELAIDLADAAATERAGAAVAGALAPGSIVSLSGELGSGKTTFARGVIRSLGWTGPVKSPTFTLVEHYPLSNLYLYHFDFYRFDNVDEWDDAGVAEAFRDDSVCLVEWPERVAGLLPDPDLAIRIEPDATGNARRLYARATTDAGRRCLNALAALER